MNEIEIQFKIKEFVLMFLNSINCEIISDNEVYFVTIPEPYSTLLEFNSLKFTFDATKSNSNSCELVAPGSKFLFKLLNYNIKIGPVVLGEVQNPNSASGNDRKLGIRFYFFVLVEGTKHHSLIKEIDVDLNTYKLMKLNNCEIVSSANHNLFNYTKDDVDYSYLRAIENLREISKQKIDDIMSTILESKNEEINSITHSFQQQIDELEKLDNDAKNKFEQIKVKNIHRKNTFLDSHSEQYTSLEEKMNISREDMIAKIQYLRLDEQKMLDMIEQKYGITIDYALIGSQIFYYDVYDSRITNF